MSREYAFLPIHGEYPLIKSEVRDGHRYVRLTCTAYTTFTHLHFKDAWKEWNDHAETISMEETLANAKD